MCRVAGLVLPNKKNNLEALQRMSDAMFRGGPDDSGLYYDEDSGISLALRRLSIIDLSEAGHQPMSDESKQYWISFNGEIYNFREIRNELETLGHSFTSRTDTEVILRAFMQWGTTAFARLNGMFAFALLDKKTGKLYLVRDHAGIKPLYYSDSPIDGETALVFASEIRAFLANWPHWPENPDWRTYFLAFGHMPEPVTTLKNVVSLPKEHFLVYDLHTKRKELHRYHRFIVSDQYTNEAETVQLLRHELLAAVNRQLVADVPVGLFLSGGIDSSVLTLAAQPILGDQLRTTSISFEQSEFSEKIYQDLIVNATAAHHSNHKLVQSEFETALTDALEAMDQPTNDGLNSYFVCKYARANGLTVALSGIGADELLGGYPSFRRSSLIQRLRMLPHALLRLGGEISYRFKKLAFLRLENEIGDYLFYRGMFAPQEIARLTSTPEKRVWELLHALPVNKNAHSLHSGNTVSYLEQNYYMQNQLLRDNDFMSMWHSLEVRVPFADRLFMEFVWNIDPALKFDKNAPPKHLLIKAFPELPRQIWDRPKKGFTMPFALWFRKSTIFYNPDRRIEPYLKQFEEGKLDWSRLWVVYLTQNYKNSHAASQGIQKEEAPAGLF